MLVVRASLNKTPAYDPFSEFGNLNTDNFGSKGFQKTSGGPMQNNMSRVSPTPLSQSNQPSKSPTKTTRVAQLQCLHHSLGNRCLHR